MLLRRRIAGAAVLAAAISVCGQAADALPPSRVALVPNAIAFRDPSHGVLGTGWLSCEYGQFGCRPQGTISVTASGGRTWRIVLRSPRPVVWVGLIGGSEWARYDDGENLRSTDGGHTWRPAVPPREVATPCPPAMAVSLNEVVTTPGGREWALCAGQGGAGNMGKAVYRLTARGWKRVAYTPFGPGGYGGISSYGYPLGIAMADDGFGLIWESRGTLYVTRDGGSHWIGLQKVARPEIDFGVSAYAVRHGVGFALLALGGSERRRLLATRDKGRTWRVVHRWG
jgi:photosystem II stability/assembly factor-like uncharacterized protein